MKRNFCCSRIFEIFTFIFCISCASCVSTPSTNIETEGERYKITANSLILSNCIKVLDIQTRIENGLLEAKVFGQNISRKDIQVEYRFVWLDNDGFEIDKETTVWKPMSLYSKEKAYMYGIATSSNAADFLMAIRFIRSANRW